MSIGSTVFGQAIQGFGTGRLIENNTAVRACIPDATHLKLM